jgi:hypothetical protein
MVSAKPTVARPDAIQIVKGLGMPVAYTVGTEHLAIVEVDDAYWVVRGIEKAGAKEVPTEQGTPAGKPAPDSKDRAAARENGG